MSNALPAIIAGPIVRHISCTQLNFWIVTSKRFDIEIDIVSASSTVLSRALKENENQQIPVGRHAYINLISINVEKPLLEECLYEYDFYFNDNEGRKCLTELSPELLYQGSLRPNFVIKSAIDNLLHGSCRKPHFDSADGLVQVDKHLIASTQNVESRPAMLMMSGDQIYADDVAGPMLHAIHQVIDLLGLHDEQLDGATVKSGTELLSSSRCYYRRDELLPCSPANKVLYDKFFATSKKPIFTSVNSKNHLVTLAEVFAMYMLVWSPKLWNLVTLDSSIVDEKYRPIYQEEADVIQRFVDSLPLVSRALAHLPVYMIFDDHDITDDWNLTRGWEEAAYGHPFSKRIIGNTLIGYWLCQGWGNAPEKFHSINEKVNQHFFIESYQLQDQLIEELLAWDHWHYSLATTPKLIVLDTRTQRWRSESNAGKPSGLMDWEALSELQQELIDQPEVILVSPAPIYGVKMIETIQRIFTFFGMPLVVDAENWMAHSGTANVILNIFRHYKTPPHFIILSGDVHYSFFYEVTHRFKRSNSRIFQITASGIKNQFPSGLLRWLERLNRYLYASYSPLNWFTKRRRMKVRVRKPNPEQRNTLVNQSGIGLLTLTHDENVVKAELLTCDDQRVLFHPLRNNEHEM